MPQETSFWQEIVDFVDQEEACGGRGDKVVVESGEFKNLMKLLSAIDTVMGKGKEVRMNKVNAKAHVLCTLYCLLS